MTKGKWWTPQVKEVPVLGLPSTTDAAAALSGLGRPANVTPGEMQALHGVLTEMGFVLARIEADAARRFDELTAELRAARAERRDHAERLAARLDGIAALLRERDYPV